MTTAEEKALEFYPDEKDIEKRKAFIEGYQKALKEHTFFTLPFKEQTSWKPSKEEMSALYIICYITDTIDDKIEKQLIRLYQNLRDEYFDSKSIENI